MNLVARWSVAAKDDWIDGRLIARVLGEHRDMPGLALTIEQAGGCGRATLEATMDTSVALVQAYLHVNG